MKRPRPKQFDISKYENLIESLKGASPIEFEKKTSIIVYDILKNYEGFVDVGNGPNFRGTPFDFIGCKNGHPHIIEYKGSHDRFHTPKETQKRRLKKILNYFKNLHIVLLQVKVESGKYRIFYDDEMDILFEGKETPLKPIINWLKNNLMA